MNTTTKTKNRQKGFTTSAAQKGFTTSAAQKGFTIIEVLIVLAIIGLIMLIVFLAVPALQRQHRNLQRKDYARQVLAAIVDFENNVSGGALPLCGAGHGLTPDPAKCAAAPGLAKEFLTKYMPASPLDDYQSPTASDVTTDFCHGESNPLQTVVYCWDDRSSFYIDHSLTPKDGQVVIVSQHFCGDNTSTDRYGDRHIKDGGSGVIGSNVGSTVSVLIGTEGTPGYFCVND